jgi:hypothetical protein
MKTFTRIAFLALILTACGSQPSEPTLTDYQLPVSVEVTFNVLVPTNTPAGESIYFTIIDDVTGLGYNPKATEMQSSGTNSYALTLSVPAGTLMKYRYVRGSASGFIDELGAAGQVITNRAYVVDGPGHVSHDLVPAWADLPSSEATGQVGGLVTAASTGAPIPGIAVNISGLQATTDSEGRFTIGGLPQGLHDIVVSAPDGAYQSFQQGALVAAGAETPAAIQLSPTTFATVLFIIQAPENSPSAVPVYIIGNTGPLMAKPALAAGDGGTYGISLQLPTGLDLRYKYTLGDGFWNAERAAGGDYVLRQLIIPAGTPSVTINDSIPAWVAGTSSPIWFDLTAPGTNDGVYLQFKLLDWTPALPMWNLGDGHYAYVLYSPTNFGSPLEYRYCRDAACTQLEANAPLRSVVGNQSSIQKIEDSIDAWQ